MTRGSAVDAASLTTVEDLEPYRADAESFWEEARSGDGYDRMKLAARHGWTAVASWGSEGWDLLDWPYYVAYLRQTPADFELATDRVGNIAMYGFPTRARRQDAIDLLAFSHWDQRGAPWALPFTGKPIPLHLRGPYSGFAGGPAVTWSNVGSEYTRGGAPHGVTQALRRLTWQPPDHAGPAGVESVLAQALQRLPIVRVDAVAYDSTLQHRDRAGDTHEYQLVGLQGELEVGWCRAYLLDVAGDAVLLRHDVHTPQQSLSPS